jgi:predicted GNAT superfamily acetyltransferase
VKIEYRKLTSPDDFSQCIDLQRSLFGLSDIDIVSPLILQLIARENPSMGFLSGAFNVDEKGQELIGFAVSMATLHKDSIYLPIIGVKPQYRNQGIGINILLKLREFALNKKIDFINWVFEPLESKLGCFYVNSLGAIGVHYQEAICHPKKTNEEDHISADKILFKWDLKTFSSYDRNRNRSKELLSVYPIASKDHKPRSPFVLVEIPIDFNLLKNEDITTAKNWRQNTREIFTHYINHHNYIIYDCLTIEENLNKKSFYLLKAQ